MPTYGRCRLTRQIRQSPMATIWMAEGVGVSGEFAVKVFLADGIMSAVFDARRQANEFLERAELQKTVGDNGAMHWAKIYELGEVEGGAYYATDYYPYCVQRLLTSHIRPGRDGLQNVVMGVASGLMEIKRAKGRTHGRLTPSNVLVTLDDNAIAQVLLTDPAPAAEIDAGSEARDMVALGRMMHDLVCNSATQEVIWPAAPSQHWEVLGSTGEAWRQLCNRLAPTNAKDRITRVEDLLSSLEQMGPQRPHHRGSGRRVLAMATAAVLVCAGTLVWLRQSKSNPQAAIPPVPTTQATASQPVEPVVVVEAIPAAVTEARKVCSRLTSLGTPTPDPMLQAFAVLAQNHKSYGIAPTDLLKAATQLDKETENPQEILWTALRPISESMAANAVELGVFERWAAQVPQYRRPSVPDPRAAIAKQADGIADQDIRQKWDRIKDLPWIRLQQDTIISETQALVLLLARNAFIAEWEARGYLDAGSPDTRISAAWIKVRDPIVLKARSVNGDMEAARKELNDLRACYARVHASFAEASLPSTVRGAIKGTCKEVIASRIDALVASALAANTPEAQRVATESLASLDALCAAIAKVQDAADASLADGRTTGIAETYSRFQVAAAAVAGDVLIALEQADPRLILVRQIRDIEGARSCAELKPLLDTPAIEKAADLLDRLSWRRLAALPLDAAREKLPDRLSFLLMLAARLNHVDNADLRKQVAADFARMLADLGKSPESLASLVEFAASGQKDWLAAGVPLPGWLEFNVYLHGRMRDEKLAEFGSDPSQFAAAANKALAEKAKSCGAKWNATFAPGLTSGPGEVPGWKKVGRAPAGVDRFSCDDGTTLDFVTVKLAGGGEFHACTTEVSLGAFARAMAVGHASPRLKKMMSDGTAAPGALFNWYWADANQAAEPRIELKANDWGFPMQAVSPAAAVYWARGVNCRLPTSSEWKQILKAAREQEGKLGVVKLRLKPGAIEPPFFVPAGFAGKAAGAWADNDVAPEAQLDTDAANAFHSSESRDGRLRDLIGNVAEYILNDPVPAGLLAGLDSGGSSDALEAWLKDRGSALGVIGGSAFSPRGVPCDQEQPVDSALAGRGFSDVGIRLVYDGSPTIEQVRSQFAAWLRNARYVGPAQTGGNERM